MKTTKNMSNLDMLGTLQGLNTFVNKDIVVPVQMSVAIVSNMKTLQEALKPYEAVRIKLQELQEVEREKQFKELLSLKEEIIIKCINADMLNELPLSTKDYLVLEFMLE